MDGSEVSNHEERAELPLAFQFTDEIMQDVGFNTGVPRATRLALAYDLSVRLVRLAHKGGASN